MANTSTMPGWVAPIVKLTGDQAATNPGTFQINPNIRSQIDMLRDQWAMKFNTPNGWATVLANMPYGRWQFGNVTAPAGAPAGWGQKPTGGAGVPGVYGPNQNNIAPTRPSNMDDWWRQRGIPTNTNGLLGPAAPTSPAQATSPATPAPSGPSGPSYAPQMPTPAASGTSGLLNTPTPTPQAPPINYQGLAPEYLQQMGTNTPLPGTPAWWALITGQGGG